MLCQECNNNEATVHMKKIVQGKKEEIHLCEECAKEKEGFNLESSFSLNNFLAGMFDIEKEPSIHIGDRKELKCDNCETDYRKFKEIGRFGCSNCYKQFKEKILPLIRRVHGNISHTGKIPKRAGGEISIKRKINELKEELKAAVDKEEFEKAAKLRDEIRRLEKQI